MGCESLSTVALLLSSLRDHGSERELYSDAEEKALETEQESD